MAYMVDIIRESGSLSGHHGCCTMSATTTRQLQQARRTGPRWIPACTPGVSRGGSAPQATASSVMTLKYDAVDCPYSHGSEPTPSKCPRREFANPSQPRERAGMATSTPGVCMKYNWYAGDCKFGARCKFLHVCQRCALEGRQLPHLRSKCTRQAQGSGIEALKPPTRATAKPRE